HNLKVTGSNPVPATKLTKTARQAQSRRAASRSDKPLDPAWPPPSTRPATPHKNKSPYQTKSKRQPPGSKSADPCVSGSPWSVDPILFRARKRGDADGADKNQISEDHGGMVRFKID
ncbi:hypothetical protein, partial [Mesorhizobium sp. Cs1299R1N3]|uniref:hypothetical protein n=1 Tax=Mesorhizobium sp. Cs1299R1N3 TaxID=3015173 RepID=UPI00301E3A73